VQCTVEMMEPCDWLETVRNLRQRCARGRHYSFVSTELVLAGLLEFLDEVEVVVDDIVDNVADTGEDDVKELL
jgi:hypothetical protein